VVLLKSLQVCLVSLEHVAGVLTFVDHLLTSFVQDDVKNPFASVVRTELIE